MKSATIRARVFWAIVAVSLVSSLALAATATLVARILWQEREERLLRNTAHAVATAIRHEADEEGWSFEQAAPEAVGESLLLDYEVEVWKGPVLLAKWPPGDPLGPFPPRRASRVPARWHLVTEGLSGGLTIAVALSKEKGLQGFRIFTRSLLISLPLCLIAAAAFGTLIGRRATRPLADFTARVVGVRGLRNPNLEPIPDAPGEVRELERSFQTLLLRLSRSVSRELEFAANASHELRTPLTRIRLYAERARADASSGTRRELDLQLQEIDRLARLADTLLVLARDVESGIPIAESVNLADLARDMATRLFAGSPAPDMEVPDEAMVRGDEDLLGIAVENLLDNARKYTPEAERVHVTLRKEEGKVHLVVASPGVTLDDTTRERLFERFFRAEDARASQQGHGLGLSLARHIAELHSGSLACEAEPNGGLAFLLTLPVWTPEPARENGRRS